MSPVKKKENSIFLNALKQSLKHDSQIVLENNQRLSSLAQQFCTGCGKRGGLVQIRATNKIFCSICQNFI